MSVNNAELGSGNSEGNAIFSLRRDVEAWSGAIATEISVQERCHIRLMQSKARVKELRERLQRTRNELAQMRAAAAAETLNGDRSPLAQGEAVRASGSNPETLNPNHP